MVKPGLPDRRARALEAHTPPAKRIKRLTLASLNDDVLLAIMGHLTQAEVLLMMRTSKRFVDVCKRRLYHTLILPKPEPLIRRLCADRGTTVITSMESALRLFSRTYSALKQGKTPDYLKYVVEVRALFLWTECSDETQVACMRSLRYMWNPVIEAMPNLSVLLAPQYELSEYVMLKDSLISKLKKVWLSKESEGMEFQPLPSKNVLSEVEDLSVNFSTSWFFDDDLNGTGEDYWVEQLSGANVAKLEVNWGVGHLDETFFDSLLFYAEVICRRAKTLRGIELGRQRGDNYFNVGSPGDRLFIDLPDHAIENIRRLEELDMLEESFKGLYSEKHTPYRVIDFTLAIMKVLPNLECISMSNIVIGRFSDIDGMMREAFADLLHVGFKAMVERGTLREIHIKGCIMAPVTTEYIEEMNFDADTLGATMCYALLHQDWFVKYAGLEKLTMNQVMVQSISVPACGENIPDDTRLLDEILIPYFAKTPSKLKEFSCIGSPTFTTDKLLAAVAPMKSLEVIRYLRHDKMKDYALRVLACLGSKFTTSIQDDQMYDANIRNWQEQVSEVIKCNHLLEDYGDHHTNFAQIIHRSLFGENVQKAFLFLYGDEVEKFFRVLPKLKRIEMYGFAFERSMFK